VAQVVEIEGPEAIEMLRKGVTNLFGFGFIEECQGGD
jgi:serine/threonine-protein kinase RIO1